jgi:hypothetical protein
VRQKRFRNASKVSVGSRLGRGVLGATEQLWNAFHNPFWTKPLGGISQRDVPKRNLARAQLVRLNFSGKIRRRRCERVEKLFAVAAKPTNPKELSMTLVRHAAQRLLLRLDL